MSRKIIVNGESICYLPPVDASEINYNNTTVKDAIDELTTTVNSKVSKSGDTITGNLSLVKSNTGTGAVDSRLYLGNDIPAGTTGATRGVISIYDTNQFKVNLLAGSTTLTADRDITLPNRSGTIALTDTSLKCDTVNFGNAGKTLTLTIKTIFGSYTRLWLAFVSVAGNQSFIQFVKAHTENNVPVCEITNIIETGYGYTVDSAQMLSSGYMQIVFKKSGNTYDSMQIISPQLSLEWTVSNT